MYKDYYAILGINRNASEKDIRQAYRRLARKYHPDVNHGEANTEELFKEINEAHTTLSDPDIRRKYDLYGSDWEWVIESGNSSNESIGTVYRGNQRHDIGSDLLGNFLGTIIGQDPDFIGRSRLSGLNVDLTLEEAYRGTTRVIEAEIPELCYECRGSRLKDTGVCGTCAGIGRIDQTRRLEIPIPAGVDSRSKIRYSIDPTTETEIHLEVNILPHRVFKRDRGNLYMDTSVQMDVAVLGGEIHIITLDGTLAMNIPPETQNGQIFRLSGQGMPISTQKGTRGDLLVTVQVTLPSNLSHKEKELFKELRAIRSEYK